MRNESLHHNNQITLILLGACANHAGLLWGLAHDEGCKAGAIGDLVRDVANFNPRVEIACELYNGSPGSEESKPAKGLAGTWAELRELDTTEWNQLQTWKFVEQVMLAFLSAKADNLPWGTAWRSVRAKLRRLVPPGNREWMSRELRDNYQRLQAKIALPSSVQPAGTEQSQRSDPENINTLPELREWLKVRMRWLRDWHMAPKDPKPIPPAFLNAILSLYGDSRYPPPSDPTKKHAWANEHIMLFSIHTIHDVHDWLQSHDIFDVPNCPSLDRITNERILEDTLEHLSALLNFIGVRADEQSLPGARSKGEPANGKSQRQRKRPGRPADTDLKRDERIYDAWKTGQYKNYEQLA